MTLEITANRLGKREDNFFKVATSEPNAVGDPWVSGAIDRRSAVPAKLLTELRPLLKGVVEVEAHILGQQATTKCSGARFRNVAFLAGSHGEPLTCLTPSSAGAMVVDTK